MLILGIETSTSRISAALGNDEVVLAEMSTNLRQRHAESLVPAVQFVCRSVGIDLSEVDAIAVAVGPGLFTGLRVGVATANAMSLALGIPLVPVNTLDALAHAAAGTDREIAAVLDARRGEVFWSVYQTAVSPGGRFGVARLTEHSVASPSAVAQCLAQRGTSLLLVGDGVARHPARFETLDNARRTGAHGDLPSAAALVEMAVPLVEGGQVSHEAVYPLYLRLPDAEANWIERETVVEGFQP